MPNYATADEVTGLLLNLDVGPLNRMTQAQVEAVIEGLEAEVHGVLLAQDYETVPVTGSGDIAMLREIIKRKAAAVVYDALFQQERSPDFVRTWHIDYSEFLTRLRKGDQRLVDQAPEAPGNLTALITHFDFGLTEVDDESEGEY